MHRGSIAAYLAAFTIMAITAAARAGDSSCASCALTGDLVFYVDDDAPPFNPSLTWLYYANDITRPVPEIGDARDLIRNYRNLCGKTGEDLDRNVIVYIREGRYAPDTNNAGYPIPLEFESQDSGSVANGYTITYQAYDGGSGPESVLISGGVVLDNWLTSSPSGGDRWWSQRLPSGWTTTMGGYLDPLKPRDLYVDNVRATRAREPDVSDSPSTQGFARVSGPIFDIPNTGTAISANLKWGNEYALDVDYEFPANAGPSARGYTPYRGIECVMRNQGGWTSQRQYVREIVPDSDTGQTYVRLHDMIGVQDNVKDAMASPPNTDRALSLHVYPYADEPTSCNYATEIYLENAKEFMDEPYEWWFNPKNSGDADTSPFPDDRMWVILPEDRVPPGNHQETPNTEIVVPYARELFKFTGCSNIELKLLNFAHTNQDLPGPIPYAQIHTGHPVSFVVSTGGGTTEFDIKSKGDMTLVEGDIDYPGQGWFDRGRTLPFYKTSTSKCGTQASLVGLEDTNRFRLVPAIRVTGGEAVKVEQCRVAHTGSTGVLIENGIGHTISGSELFDLGGPAIAVARANMSTQFCTLPTAGDGIAVVPTSFTIEDNFIYDCGQTYLSSSAIFCGWTAPSEPPMTPPAYSVIASNYIMDTPSEAIFMGFQPNDGVDRVQTHRVDVFENVVLNPAQLLDDMAGIVMLRDADDSFVTENVIFQNSSGTGNTPHGLYTDGDSVISSITPSPTGWMIEQNLIWGVERAFHMNTAATCPEDNDWSYNYVESDNGYVVCASCSSSSCGFMVTVTRSKTCGNGYSVNLDHGDMNYGLPPVIRYVVEPDLADPMLRPLPAKAIADLAGPQTSARPFLYTTHEPLIHPAAATNRTPPSP